MKKKITVLELCAMLFAVCGSVDAQQPKKVSQIGYLSAGQVKETGARYEAFRQVLRELGYVEGKNIIIEFRSADGKFDRLPALAAELVRLKVDVIVTGGPPSAGAAQGSNLHDSHCDDAGR